MKEDTKILFWINSFFLHFSLAYYIQKHIDNANFFGIVDCTSKQKQFFESQKLVDFKKIWFYHDHIHKNSSFPDLEYLSNFEKKYKINLWKIALNERYFYKYNRFYSFKKEEILSILEQEIKLFEKILNEIKPDFFLTYNPVLHHQKLFLDICKENNVKILNSARIGIDDQTVLVENAETFDLDLSKSLNYYYEKEHSKFDKQGHYDLDQKNWIQNKNVNILDKLSGLKDYIFDRDTFLQQSNFMYYGRTKFKVLKDALSLEFRKNRNYNFLKNNSTPSPSLDVPYVYFPMNINEEASLLHYAPFFTNQIEVIRHIAKSIPIDFHLYVKEHVASGLRYWNDVSYYKEILEIPNVTLIHPNFDNNALIQNSKLVVIIRGTSHLKAMQYGIPSITFGKQPYQIVPSVFYVESLNDLPKLIKNALNFKPEPLELEKFEDFFATRSFDFPLNVYEVLRNQNLLSGKGVFSNVSFSEQKILEFLQKNEKLFSSSINAHLKSLSLK